jgi:uncharacterized RDD family membrane protein YckC
MTNPVDSAPPPAVPPPAAPPPPASWRPPPEEPGPAPGLKFASHGPRLVAYIIDSIIVWLILAVVFAILAGGFVTRMPAFDFPNDVDFETGEFRGRIPAGMFAALFAAMGAFLLVSLVVTFAYFTLSWARSGQTPAMRLFGLYVVRDSDGGRISTGQAILRVIGTWVAAFPFFIGFFWIFIDARRRGWHDLIAGTVVVERKT